MHRLLVLLISGFLFLSLTSPLFAISLYVDSAPNAYGSSDYDPWWTETKEDVASGSFTNLSTGTFPGTTTIDPYDEIVYSTEDLGKRLHWIYWMPDTTITELEGNFEVKYIYDWAGTDYTYDWSSSDTAENDQTTGWIEPGSWEEYQNGVIGTFGHAWWANDDHAEPFDTGGTAYDETDQADIDALRDIVFQNQTFATGMVRIRDDADSGWETTSLQTNVVPEPTTWLLFGTGLLGLLAVGRKKIFNRGQA